MDILVDQLSDRLPRLAYKDAASPLQGKRIGISLVDPKGSFELAFTRGSAQPRPADGSAADASLTLPAEAFIRLLYGRLDLSRELNHDRARARGDRGLVAKLTEVFPGF